MILCSCNLICTEKVKNYLQNSNTENIPSVGTVIRGLNCNAVCGMCSINIKNAIDNFYEENE